MKESINIYWFKRDLRTVDNLALANALNQKNKLLLIYCFGKSLLDDEHYSKRHICFINESLIDLNLYFKKFETRVHFFEDNIISIIKKLKTKFDIEKVFSHTETGLEKSFKRDLKFKDYCNKNKIKWIEEINNGVFRGLKNRKNWILNLGKNHGFRFDNK